MKRAPNFLGVTQREKKLKTALRSRSLQSSETAWKKLKMLDTDLDRIGSVPNNSLSSKPHPWYGVDSIADTLGWFKENIDAADQ